MTEQSEKNILILKKISREAMIEKGLEPDFPPEVLNEVANIDEKSGIIAQEIKDLRHLLWCSIDNDDSKDLDQLSFGELLDDGNAKILVAIADVDALVKKGSEIDIHASKNTTSVYTSVQIFPMLPEKLSTNLSSLNFNEDRLAMVFEMIVDQEGIIIDSKIYNAIVHNYAKLAYNSVSKWLEKKEDIPENIKKVEGLAENIFLQYSVAKKLRLRRFMNGALNFDTKRPRAYIEGDNLKLASDDRNRAKELIEDLMIAVNGVSARFLESKGFPSVRRVVRTPKRWNRIVELALKNNYKLPEESNSKALDEFLIWSKKNNSENFAELSLSIIKLLGPGEYVIEKPEDEKMGHFGLAVKDYSHSTAPNRRYPDIITQRLLKAALKDKSNPYTEEELKRLAEHCTLSENAAKKVERKVEKSSFILFLETKIGQEFKAIVTGKASKGMWVKLMYPPVEGKLVKHYSDIDIGDKINVKLIDTDVEKGFIDFVEI